MVGKHPQSVKDCRKSIELLPSQFKLYSRASKGLLFMGDISAATSLLRSGISLLKEGKSGSTSSVAADHMRRLNSELDVALRIEKLVGSAIEKVNDKKDFKKALSDIESAISAADVAIVPSYDSSSGLFYHLSICSYLVRLLIHKKKKKKKTNKKTGPSKLSNSDLSNISVKWRLLRAAALVGLKALGVKALGEAGKTVS